MPLTVPECPGGRLGDLMKMTTANVIDGAIEYDPRKTKEGRPYTVRARALLCAYYQCIAKFPSRNASYIRVSQHSDDCPEKERCHNAYF